VGLQPPLGAPVQQWLGALQFTDKESIALAALLQSPNYPVSHTQLFDLLRSGGEEYDAHRIDALIYRVRQKLRSLEKRPCKSATSTAKVS
jgi:DNA-binding response OmpR family regulator